MLKVILKLIGIFAILIGIIISVYFRFSNPDMTETRLLLAYWPQMIIILPIVILGIFLVFLDE